MSVLWSVLAGIGTVLLFLLKGVGILLLVVLVLGLLLMFCPFCADVQWAECIFQVKAGALGITFPVFRYPAPEKPEKKKKEKNLIFGILQNGNGICHNANRQRDYKSMRTKE